MKLPTTAHTSRPWRIHELTPDFRLDDAGDFRMPGAGPDGFPVMLAALRAAGGLNEDNPPLVRSPFAVRWTLGALFGSDKPEEGFDEAGRVAVPSAAS